MNKEEQNKYQREYKKRNSKKAKEWAKKSYYKYREKRIEEAKIYKRKHRKEIGEYLDKIKREKGCSVCGEKDPSCLDFHHSSKEKKEMAIGNMIVQGRPLIAIKEEIKKCIVICSNCHRKLHAKNR